MVSFSQNLENKICTKKILESEQWWDLGLEKTNEIEKFGEAEDFGD